MCTSIKINYKDGCVLARTLDFETPLEYNVLYQPAGYHYANDLFGKAIRSKYRVMGIIFYKHLPLKDGVNEHGLMGCTNLFHTMNLFPNEIAEGKTNLASLDYFTYALASYKNVDELVEDLDNIHISNYNHRGMKTICPDFHFMFADRSNKCVVIEAKNKKLIAYDNPYDVMTNSPSFPSHIKKLEKTIDIDKLDEFKAAKNLPGGYDPSSRFIKAFYLSKTQVPANSYQDALSNAYSIMEAMKMPKGFVKNDKYNHHTYTRYICAYESKNALLTARSHENSTIYQLGFDDIENKDDLVFIPFKRGFTSEKFR